MFFRKTTDCGIECESGRLGGAAAFSRVTPGRTRRKAAIAALSCIIALLAAAAASAAERKVACERLDNGLLVAVCESHASPVAAIQVWVRAGSAWEGELSGSGVSHFMEHMIFKGTEKRKVGDFDREIRGAGGDMNAYTSADEVVLHAEISSRHWRQALSALADVVQNSTFDPEEFSREREVILRELAERAEDPDWVLSRLYSSTMYRVHPYGLPVGGYVEGARKLARGETHAFYRRIFVPNNMVLVVAGDVSAPEAMEAARRELGGLERAPLAPVAHPSEPPQTGPRREVARHPRATHARISIGYRTVSATDPDLYALDVAAVILGDGRSSRLYRRLKGSEPLALETGAYSNTPVEAGDFAAWAVCDEPRLSEVERAILDEMETLRSRGVSESELARAKNVVAARHVMSQQTTEGLAASVGWDALTTGDPDFSERYVARVKAVTAREVREACRKHLRPECVTIAAVLPPLAAAAPAAGAAPPAVEAEGRKVVRKELAGGLRMIVLEAHELPLVSVSAVCLGGLRSEDPGKSGLAELTARMLTRGTSRLDAAAIAERMESVGGSLNSSGGRNSFSVSAAAPSEHAATAILLVADCMTDPAFPEKEFELAKADLLAEIDAREESLYQVCGDLLFSKLFDGHPYSRPVCGSKETVSPLTASDAKELHARAASPANVVVALVGDISSADAEKLVAKAFRFERAKSARPEPPPQKAAELQGAVSVSQAAPRATDQAVTMIGFPGVAIADADSYALDCVEAVLAGMGSRLFLALRDRDEPLAYAVGCYNFPQLDPGAFVLYISTAPASAAKARERMLKVVSDLVESGPTAEEVAFAKRHVSGVHEIGLQSCSSVALKIALDELYGLGAERTFGYAERVEKLTRDDMAAAARKYLDAKRCVVAVVAPGAAGEKKPQEAPPQAPPTQPAPPAPPAPTAPAAGAAGGDR